MSIQGVSPRQQAFRLVMLQIIAAGIVTVCWLLSGWEAAISALLGGLSIFLPSLYFAYRFFITTHARQAGKIIRAFYVGELIKLLFSAFLVILISRLWPEMAILAFLSGLIAAQLSVWLAPLVNEKDDT